MSLICNNLEATLTSLGIFMCVILRVAWSIYAATPTGMQSSRVMKPLLESLSLPKRLIGFNWSSISPPSNHTNIDRKNFSKVKRVKFSVPRKKRASFSDVSDRKVVSDEFNVSRLHLGRTFWLLEVHRNHTSTSYILESEGHGDYFHFSLFSVMVLSYIRTLGHVIYDCLIPEDPLANSQLKKL